jgi:hypothetical protein
MLADPMYLLFLHRYQMLYMSLCFHFDKSSKMMNLNHIDIVEYIEMNLLNMKLINNHHYKLDECVLVHYN